MHSRDVAAEVLALLRVKALSDGEALDSVLYRHLLQRFVAWVASSELRGKLVLKGGMLLDVFDNPSYKRWHRQTDGADFLAREDIDPAALCAALAKAQAGGGGGDGVSFDLASLSVRPAPAFRGVRTYLGRVVGRIQGGAQTLSFRVEYCDGPCPAHTDVFVYPVIELPSMPHPRPLALKAEAAVAERLESLYWRGTRGTRFEDFVDLQSLLEATSPTLDEVVGAIGQQFRKRGLSLPTSLPASLRETFFDDPEAKRRWARFIQRQHGRRADELALRAKAVQDDLPTIAGALARHVSRWLAHLSTR